VGRRQSLRGIDGPNGDLPAATLSTERPWSRGIAWLPTGAPRNVTTVETPIGWVPRYPTIEWALSNGYPKYSASAGWATYERHFVCWAERHGYKVDVITQHDLHLRPQILGEYRCAVIVGHDEPRAPSPDDPGYPRPLVDLHPRHPSAVSRASHDPPHCRELGKQTPLP
jgi:hypothetical protein